MLEIVEGSIDEYNSEMKRLIKLIQSRVTQFNKNVHYTQRTKQQEATLKKHQAFIDRFRVTKMTAVKVGPIIINYKKYQQLEKKLKRFNVHLEIKEKQLNIHYENIGAKGIFTLYDISHLAEEILEYKDFLPRAKIIDY